MVALRRSYRYQGTLHAGRCLERGHLAYAEGNSAAELGFRYRKTGEETWTEVDKEQINISGGAFDTCITGLTPEPNTK